MVGGLFSRAVGQTKEGVLMSQLVDAVQSGLSVLILTDFDGTLFPLKSNPDEVEIDPEAMAALTALAQRSNVRICGLTGRDVHRAKEMLNGLDIDIVGSHGAECLRRDGRLEQFPFSQKQMEHIEGLKKAVHNLPTLYPGVLVEINKYGSVGLNMNALKGKDGAEETRRKIFELFEQYKQSGEFDVVKEGAKGGDDGWEVELRPAEDLCGKHIGISTFIPPEENKMVLFFCDSLEGTDHEAAIMVNNLPGGYVVMVENGRIAVPDSSAPHAPSVVFDSPAALGNALRGVVAILESKPAPEKGLELVAPHQG